MYEVVKRFRSSVADPCSYDWTRAEPNPGLDFVRLELE